MTAFLFLRVCLLVSSYLSKSFFQSMKIAVGVHLNHSQSGDLL